MSKRMPLRRLAALLSVSLLVTSLFAAETFLVDGRKAVIHAAAKPAEGKPWLWYAPALNGGVSIVQHKLYADACQQAGIAIAGYDLGEVRGAPKSAAQFMKFYDEMVKRGYSPKPILLGQSRGGMMTLTWAFRNPEKVKAWIGIYPVCNLASWSLKNSKAFAACLNGPDPIGQAYSQALQRRSTAVERSAAEKLIARYGKPAFCRALLNSNELIFIE